LECKNRDVVCVFDASSDKRRKIYLSKIELELRYYREFSNNFLMAIGTSHYADVHHIIDIVRSGSSISEIKNVVTRVLTDNRASQRDT
jgi:hypothetical protein